MLFLKVQSLQEHMRIFLDIIFLAGVEQSLLLSLIDVCLSGRYEYFLFESIWESNPPSRAQLGAKHF